MVLETSKLGLKLTHLFFKDVDVLEPAVPPDSPSRKQLSGWMDEVEQWANLNRGPAR